MTDELSVLLAEARIAFERRGDRTRAAELVERALAQLDGTGTSAELCERFAARLVMLDDFARAEPFMRRAIELESAREPISPIVLGTRHMFYAKHLHAARRFREAAHHASEGVAWYAKGCAPGDRELAFVRADAARIVASYWP
ncbi:MAG TPA: hypothetical protein VGL61_36765 [Kofleriaceae bacterium]